MNSPWNPHTAQVALFKSDLCPVLYTLSTPSSLSQRIGQVARAILDLLCWPYHILHRWVGYYVIPASFLARDVLLRCGVNWSLTTFSMATLPIAWGVLPVLSQMSPPVTRGWLSSIQERIFQSCGIRSSGKGQWQIQRFTVMADQQPLDALFLGNRKNLDTVRRVLLYCCSQNELAEGKVYDDSQILALADQTQAGVVLWNSPGLGATPGALSRESLIKACAVMMRFVQDAAGLGAQEMICMGHSLGASVLLEAQKHYPLQVCSVFVLRGARSTTEKGPWLTRFSGWHWDNLEALRWLQAPAILLQTAAVEGYQPLTESSVILPDEVITEPDATLAKAVLDQGSQRHPRHVIGINRWHNDSLSVEEIGLLARDIMQCMSINI